jgi:ABC-2 type transport system ATP-binding protein
MKSPILKLENIRKEFSGNVVLDGINIEIYSGEILGIIGSSGSGKTTFLNTLIGFLPPDSGEIYFYEGDTEKLEKKSIFENHDMLKKKFGFASQVPSFYSKLTVFENLDYFGSLYNLSKEARLHNINTLLDLVELSAARDVISENLSGGMQRRLDIACSLIHNPDILILDEPTSDLDPMLGRHIWSIIQRINKRGTTIIVASHNFPEIEANCTRIGIIAKGKMIHLGSLHELTSTLSKGQEIHVETYPGNYEKILKLINDPLIIGKENRGNELIIHTSKPDKVLTKLLNVLFQAEESLMDLRISRLNLGDVFTKVSRKQK